MEHVVSIAVLVAVLAQTGLIIVLVAVGVSKVRVMRDQLVAFVSPVSEGQASPLATSVDAAADMFARATMARAKMTFAGLSSGVTRQEAAVEGDIAEDSARMNPIIGGLMDSFPTLKKTLRKNPALLDFAMSKLLERLGPSAGGGANGDSVQLLMQGLGKINK